jgi:starch synthase (maltosyl-transferring)
LPSVDGGTRAAKSVVDEQFWIQARVFREGHDAVNATAVLTDPDGVDHAFPMTSVNVGLSLWNVQVSADRAGWWTYRVEGWSDPWETWVHDGTIKVEAGIDEELMLEEGARVVEHALAALPDSAPASARTELRDVVTALRDPNRPPIARLRAATAPEVHAIFAAYPFREKVSPSAAYPLLVERELALFGAWYEIFPRSEGATKDPETGTWTRARSATAAKRLPAIAAMGFDVVYLTPIHPIGTTARKGRNNTLNARPGRSRQPLRHRLARWRARRAAPRARHVRRLRRLRGRSRAARDGGGHGHRAAGSPDHPWVTDAPGVVHHPRRRHHRLRREPAEEVPGHLPAELRQRPGRGIYAEMRRHDPGLDRPRVKIFRVDNPHTKPLEFWQWLIADVTPRPPRRHLARRGLHQARDDAHAGQGGLPAVLHLLRMAQRQVGAGGLLQASSPVTAATYMRPSFWPTTHDILTPFMQYGGPTAWKLRAAIAATLVPTYGIYTGYELMESVARPGVEEQIDNEKYEFKDRRWADYEPGGPKDGQSLAGYLTMLNAARKAHPALHWMRNLHFHHAPDDAIMCFSKSRVLPDGRRDTVIVVANLDPHSTRETQVDLDLPALGLPWGSALRVHDLVTDAVWDWGQYNYVRLGADTEPVHILEVLSP